MSGPFAQLEGHEQVVYGHDPPSGLRCIIALHDTRLGPGLGGTRFFPYDDETTALTDVLRLSRAMTYKAACAGLDLGGGKAVIIGDPAADKSEARLRAYGRFIASLGGRYVTACDVGTVPADMDLIKRETPWATGGTPAEGGTGDSGVATALGVFEGIRACAARVWGSAGLRGRHVAVQGVGKVGRKLVEHLHSEGAKITVADVNPDATAWAAEHAGAEIAPPDKVHGVDCDVLSPNALGGVIDDVSVGELACAIVAGGANNQLAHDGLGAALADRGICYAPDYVINAGGLIQVSDERHAGGWSRDRVTARVTAIGDRLHEIFDYAETAGVPTSEAADRVAERRIAAVSRLRGVWLAPRP
jgi:valine dehydrogenase (NAD+)